MSCAQLVHVEVRRVDERVGDVADGVEQLALLDDGAPHRLRTAERMRTPRFGVAPHQHGILGVKKNHARVQQISYGLQDFGQAVEGRAFANVHHDGGPLHFGGLADQAGEIGQQFHRQIVDAVKSQVLKSLERRSFARAGDSGNDHQIPWLAWLVLSAYDGSGRLVRGLPRRHGFMLHRHGSDSGPRSRLPSSRFQPVPVPAPDPERATTAGPGRRRNPCERVW